MRYALCMIVLGLGWAHPEQAAAETEAPPSVHAVVIQGNEQIPESDILDRLATHPPEGLLTVRRYELDRTALAGDRERIRRLYRERGFFSARVDEVHVVELGANRVGVRIDVVEGEPTRIQTRELVGLPEGFEPSERLALALEDLEEGDVFRHAAYVQVRQRLRRALRERGHAHASVTGSVRVDRQRAKAFVTLRADPGPLVRYGDVEVSGLERLPESVVRNRIAWEPGEIFSPKKMETTQGRLYELGYFSSIRLDVPSQGSPDVVDVDVRTTEGPRRELQLGGGLAFDNQFFEARARAGYQVKGFFDPLLSARAAARPAYQIRRDDPGQAGLAGEASLTFERIDFGLPGAQGRAQLAVRRTEFEAYDSRGGVASLGWRIPLFADRFDVNFGWDIRPFFELVNVHPAIEEEANADIAESLGTDVSPYRLAFFHQTLVADLRDNILSPTRGGYVSLRLEQGGPFAGGKDELTYLKASAELRGYLPLGERVVLAARGELGNTPAGTLPITQRYLAGGASSHRGFPYRRLSPTLEASGEIDREPIARIGGGALLESSFELRTRITRLAEEWLSVALFADGGDVRMELGDIALRDLHWAIGTGLRYNTLIGPVRLDFGYRITSLSRPGGPVERNRLVVHFSLGEAF